MRGLLLCVLSCLAGSVAGNLVSPGLGKCLEIVLTTFPAGHARAGTEELVADLRTALPDADSTRNVQLADCRAGSFNQRFSLIEGQIRAVDVAVGGRDFCLTAEDALYQDGANVHLQQCAAGIASQQQWVLMGTGQIQLKNDEPKVKTSMCLDVHAQKTADGGREIWSEIKKHRVVNAQLFTCHGPAKTWRVNQFWAWQPVDDDGTLVTAEF